MEEIKTNRQYKDRLFKLVFKTKEDLLDLYNAINGTNFTNADDMEINTIEECVYMSMRNDVSFLLYDVMNLYEHQSTNNPNMPLRGLFYLSMLYKERFKDHQDLYRSRQIKLPTPQFIVFYNGDEEEPDEHYVSMSDAYIGQISGTPALDCRARFLNINYGHNKALMEKCKRLNDYSKLIKYVKDNLKNGIEKSVAIKRAIDRCIQEDVLKDILLKHRMEVEDVLLTEYNEIEHINNEKSISYEEGFEEGMEKGQEQGVQDAFDVLSRLKAGESRESIILSGVKSSTVDAAIKILN